MPETGEQREVERTTLSGRDKVKAPVIPLRLLLLLILLPREVLAKQETGTQCLQSTASTQQV